MISDQQLIYAAKPGMKLLLARGYLKECDAVSQLIARLAEVRAEIERLKESREEMPSHV